ncbi:MAG: glycosyltransferase [Nostoc sp. RI_552]|nr:glycosyltransferase [Nostoc sp. RI_552]
MLEQITPLILTYDEAPNIERTLQQLTWAKTIIVIDSYSTDETLEILSDYPQITVFKRKFDSFACQCNYGLQQVKSQWVLSLDADYILTDEIVNEINNLPLDTTIDGYFAKFKYCVFGKPLRGTMLPPRQVLYRREKASYQDDGHAHLVLVEGKSSQLTAYIHHDDRKSLNRWLWAQQRYMVIETKKLLETPNHELSLGDRIRKQKIFAPFIVLFYCLIIKGGILDGKYGLYYALQRVLAEILLSINLIEASFNKSAKSSSGSNS